MNVEQNPKNIIVRNAAGQTRRARKSELEWFAERGWRPDDARQTTDDRRKVSPPTVEP